MLTTKVWSDPLYFIACGFGSGLSSWAPGTMGTVAAIPIYLLLANTHLSLYVTSLLTLFLLGVWITGKVSEQLGETDHPSIVLDEIVGYCLTMIGAPFSIGWMIWGFVLFRVFDIWKPIPIRLIDRYVSGGLGIMLDDALAAIPAWLLLQLTLFAFPQIW